ncbi:MAG TPA: hypothetical protein VNJ08_11925 [Bacteriovoracaceae bacterium]|nr:hypothetical protein [Bacteriovoracaceae bacterium]
MKILSLIIFIFFFNQSLFAETVLPLTRVNLDLVSEDNRPLVFRSKKFNISLMNGFCESNKSDGNVSRVVLARNIEFLKRELPDLIHKFESLINELKPGFFEANNDFFPLDFHLSIDGNESCYNATAEGNHIEIPAQSNPDYVRGVFDLIYHEIGHVLGHFNGYDQNLFDETIADAISLLLLNPNGIFYLGISSEREELKRRIDLGKRDPHALAAELEVEYTSVPSWLKENGLKYKCISDDHYRDMRNDIPLADALEGGGESYIVSCAVHSYLGKLGRKFGSEKVLKNFVKAYLNDSLSFNDIDISRVMNGVFKNVDHTRVDPSFNRLSLKPTNAGIILLLTEFTDEDGEHFKLTWDHPNLNLDWGVVAFKDLAGKSVASFSLSSVKQGAVLTAQNRQTCLEDRLVCYCPASNWNRMELQLGWMSSEGGRTQSKVLELPPNTRGCFELGVPENLKTK